MRRDFISAAMLAAAALLALPLAAQIPPSPAEIAAYRGLHAAAQRGDLMEIERLATARPALAARDAHGRTPLHVATYARQREAVKALLRAGADPGALDADRYDAVTIAAVADDEETLRVLLAGGASAKLVTSRYDGTALIAAAHLGHDGVVQQLIAAGAPLDHVNNLHWTALIEAVVLGDGKARHQAVVAALLAAGASTSLADRDGKTPLQLAKSRGYAEIVQSSSGPARSSRRRDSFVAGVRHAPDMAAAPASHLHSLRSAARRPRGRAGRRSRTPGRSPLGPPAPRASAGTGSGATPPRRCRHRRAGGRGCRCGRTSAPAGWRAPG